VNSDIDQAVVSAATQQADLDSRLQEIFMRNFGLMEKEGVAIEAGYKAYGLLAVDIAVRLTNMFIAVKTDKGVYRVACDLSYQMATNEFWAKNASVLMPIMHVCLNTHRDGVMMLADRVKHNEYSSNDALISASRAAPLEIFPVIAYLLGGPVLMVSASLPLKRDLAPYFLS
jgi:hypothetical protein